MENLPLDPLNEICNYFNRFDFFQLKCCNNSYKIFFNERLQATRPLGSYKTLKYLFKFYDSDFVLDSLMRVAGCKMVAYNIPWIVYNLSIEKSRKLSERVCISFSSDETNDAVIELLDGGDKVYKYSDNLIHQCVKERNFNFIALIKEKCSKIFKDGVYESYLVKYGLWELLPTKPSDFIKWRKFKSETPLYYLTKYDNWQDFLELPFFKNLDLTDIISGLIKHKKYKDIIKFANLWEPREIFEKSIQSGDINMIKILDEIIPSDINMIKILETPISFYLMVKESYKVIPNIQWLKYLIKKKIPWKPFRNINNKLNSYQLAMKNTFKEYFHDKSWYETEKDEEKVYQALLVLMIQYNSDDKMWKDLLTPRIMHILIDHNIIYDRVNIMMWISEDHQDTIEYIIRDTIDVPLQPKELTLMLKSHNLQKLELITKIPFSQDIINDKTGDFIDMGYGIKIKELLLSRGCSIKPTILRKILSNKDAEMLKFVCSAFQKCETVFDLDEEALITIVRHYDYEILKKLLELPGVRLLAAKGKLSKRFYASRSDKSALLALYEL